ncbi:MAG: putative rRNA maturation factor [Arenicella sp.]|jgi:probable rRNA maturation factor
MISFFSEEIDFELSNQEKISSWLGSAIEEYEKQLVEISYVFCSDEYLHKINVEYLNHDTYTDIITFDNSETEEEVESDIFVSVDRVKENAKEFGVSFEQELHRVLIHGLLHLLGFKDKTETEATEMRKQEEAWLRKLENE